MSQQFREIHSEGFYHLNQVNGYRNVKLSVGDIVRTSKAFNPMRQSWESGATDLISPYAAASSYWRFTKEQIFEEERLKIDADLPSRLKSIWLTDGDNLEYWYETLSVNSLAGPFVNGVKDLFVFSVEAKGKVFEGDAHWYESISNPIPLLKVRSYARHYWKGEIFKEGHKELLLEGEMSIVEEVLAERLIK